ncbi:MAG: hypothetical protein OEZ59_00465, partial [Deltaproteobacteria bacterium]|nr:hypothetical protein [Deltaproteobacteria bacterium]
MPEKAADMESENLQGEPGTPAAAKARPAKEAAPKAGTIESNRDAWLEGADEDAGDDSGSGIKVPHETKGALAFDTNKSLEEEVSAYLEVVRQLRKDY